MKKKLANFIEEFGIEEFEDMERLSKDEKDRIVKLSGWDSKVIPRPVTALAVFISLSKFLERYDWVEYFENAVLKILSRNSCVSPKENLQAKEIKSPLP